MGKGYLLRCNGNAINIPELRKNLRFTQKELALLLGVTVDTVQGWENGRKQPRSTARLLLCMLAIDAKTTMDLLKKI